VGLILLLESLPVAVKGVAVFHGKFPDPDQAGPGTWIVAPLGLNLVDQGGQALIGIHLLPGSVSNSLFMGHGKNHIPADPILETAQFLVDAEIATGLFPDICRIHDRHQYFLTPDAVHFFPDNLFDFFD